VTATLVVADNNGTILIRTRDILIQNQGSLLIGSETCPYMSNLSIALYGQNNDSKQLASFGGKFIIVNATGSIDIHGPWKLSWTLLSTTIQPGTMFNYLGQFEEKNVELQKWVDNQKYIVGL